MALDSNQAIQIKELLENGPIQNVITYAQKAYPNECCGFIMKDGAIFPAQNIIETLQDKSLTSKTAFLIDDESWKIANLYTSHIACIYHSHTNGDPDMSEIDKHTLRWQDLYYVIIGLIDAGPTSINLFWWEDKDLHKLNIKL